MFKTYEDLKDFIKALKAKDKSTEICMKIIPHRRDDILSAEILMQFIDESRLLCHTHHYVEGLKAIKILPSGVFNVISDDKSRNYEETRYDDLLNQFDTIVKEEFQKAKDMFKQLGYENIIDCVYTSG